MDIGRVSVDAAAGGLMQAVQLSLLKKSLDSEESAASTIVDQMMPQQAPSFGHKLDIRA